LKLDALVLLQRSQVFFQHGRQHPYMLFAKQGFRFGFRKAERGRVFDYDPPQTDPIILGGEFHHQGNGGRIPALCIYEEGNMRESVNLDDPFRANQTARQRRRDPGQQDPSESAK
jgi:hypothetical protein